MSNYSDIDENSDFMSVLKYCHNYVKNSELLENKRIFPIVAPVVINIDPEKRRRIKVADPLFGGKLQSNWIRPIRVTQNNDPPLPQINQLVIIFFIEGDSEKGFYLPLMNDTNPSLVKNDEVLDHAENIEGNKFLQINGNDKLIIKNDSGVEISGNQTINITGDRLIELIGEEKLDVDKSIEISAGQTVLIKNDAGAFISLNSSGIVVIQDAYGRKITLGGSSNSEWNLNHFPLNIVNANGVSINGKQIATVGAVDSDGDTITNKGWINA